MGRCGRERRRGRTPIVTFEIDKENYRDVIERRIGEAKRQREASVN